LAWLTLSFFHPARFGVDNNPLYATVARSGFTDDTLRYFDWIEQFMPNTKSAERRMRNSARKQTHNRSIKSRLHTLEKKYLQLLDTGKKEDAGKTLQAITSAFDKAAKSGVIHRATASRKKSRLAIRFAKTK
jgi:small subunit ribosomal protein S20